MLVPPVPLWPSWRDTRRAYPLARSPLCVLAWARGCPPTSSCSHCPRGAPGSGMKTPRVLPALPRAPLQSWPSASLLLPALPVTAGSLRPLGLRSVRHPRGDVAQAGDRGERSLGEKLGLRGEPRARAGGSHAGSLGCSVQGKALHTSLLPPLRVRPGRTAAPGQLRAPGPLTGVPPSTRRCPSTGPSCPRRTGCSTTAPWRTRSWCSSRSSSSASASGAPCALC